MLGNLDQIRAFVAASDYGSFSAAARRLGRAQSLISTHIAMLEADLGLELFARTGRNPELTEAGHALLAEAREVLRQYGQFKTRALALCASPEAELRLALDEGLPYVETGQLCAELATGFPHLKVQLLHGSTPEVHYWVAHENVHLGVAYDLPAGDLSSGGQPGKALATTLERHWIGQVKQVLVASETHPLAALPSVSIRDLTRHRQIITRFALAPVHDPCILSPSVWETNSCYMAVDLALRGIGWTIVPVPVAVFSSKSDPVPEGLRILNHPEGVPDLNIQLLRKAGQPATPATSWLTQRLRELF